MHRHNLPGNKPDPGCGSAMADVSELKISVAKKSHQCFRRPMGHIFSEKSAKNLINHTCLMWLTKTLPYVYITDSFVL